jgi:hypothetical protein
MDCIGLFPSGPLARKIDPKTGLTSMGHMIPLSLEAWRSPRFPKTGGDYVYEISFGNRPVGLGNVDKCDDTFHTESSKTVLQISLAPNLYSKCLFVDLGEGEEVHRAERLNLPSEVRKSMQKRNNFVSYHSNRFSKRVL